MRKIRAASPAPPRGDCVACRACFVLRGFADRAPQVNQRMAPRGPGGVGSNAGAQARCGTGRARQQVAAAGVLAIGFEHGTGLAGLLDAMLGAAMMSEGVVREDGDGRGELTVGALEEVEHARPGRLAERVPHGHAVYPVPPCAFLSCITADPGHIKIRKSEKSETSEKLT